MIQSWGTSPVAALWQGFVSGGVLEPRAQYGCTLTRLSAGNFQLNTLPTWLNDNSFAIAVNLFTNAPTGWSTSILFSQGNGTAIITIEDDGTPTDPPGLFNIIVNNCTDGVNLIESNP